MEGEKRKGGEEGRGGEQRDGKSNRKIRICPRDTGSPLSISVVWPGRQPCTCVFGAHTGFHRYLSSVKGLESNISRELFPTPLNGIGVCFPLRT